MDTDGCINYFNEEHAGILEGIFCGNLGAPSIVLIVTHINHHLIT